MEFDNMEELMNYQKNEINQSMKEVNKEVKVFYKKYNLFHRLIMRIRLIRKIGRPYVRSNDEF